MKIKAEDFEVGMKVWIPGCKLIDPEGVLYKETQDQIVTIKTINFDFPDQTVNVMRGDHIEVETRPYMEVGIEEKKDFGPMSGSEFITPRRKKYEVADAVG